MPQQANNQTPPEEAGEFDRLAAHIIRHMRSPNTHRISVDTAQWAALTGLAGDPGDPGLPDQQPAVILEPDPPVLIQRHGRKPALLHSVMLLPEDEGRKVVLFLTEGQQMAMAPRPAREGTGHKETTLGLVAACAAADRVEIVLNTQDPAGRPGRLPSSNGNGRRGRKRTVTMTGPFGEDIASDGSDGSGPSRHNVSGHLRMGRHRLKDGTWRTTREWVNPHTRRTPQGPR